MRVHHYASIFALAAAGLAGSAQAAVVVASGSPGTTGLTALYMNLPGEISAEAGSGATAAELATMLGAPDDAFTGLGSFFVTYDLGNYRVINGAGQDFNVYEVDFGAVEFGSVEVLVSANGVTFFNVNSTINTALNLAGDETHSNASFRRSFDLAGAAAALGTSQFRYVRLNGTSGGFINGSTGFDVDSVGYANFALIAGVVPEPSTWAMMILGFGAVGGVLRRRSGAAKAARMRLTYA